MDYRKYRCNLWERLGCLARRDGQSQQRSRGCFTVHGMEWCWLFL